MKDTPRTPAGEGQMTRKKLTVQDVELVLECLPEDLQIEGNASAIDPETDRQTVEWIKSKLEAGNEWAWCMVKVTARWNGLEASDSLGACSYKNEEEFKQGGYYEDMVQNVLDELQRQAEAIVDKLDG